MNNNYVRKDNKKQYITRKKILVLVIARFGVQLGQYFPNFSYFVDLFHEPFGGRNTIKYEKRGKY